MNPFALWIDSDPGYRFVASFFASARAFFCGSTRDGLRELVKCSLSASVDCVIAHALCSAQAVGSFCRQDVHDGRSFARLVAIRVSAFVDGFGVGDGAGAYEGGQHESLQHCFCPSLDLRSVA